MIGIILAGGLGTRLGPLAATHNKSLVTVGQQPMLARHYLQLKDAGCGDVLIVVNKQQLSQVRSVAQCAGLEDLQYVVQPELTGPAGAVACGANSCWEDEEVIVIMADTLLQSLPKQADTVLTDIHIGQPRHFCTVDETYALPTFHDKLAEVGELVTVGAYRFSSSERLASAYHITPSGGMADLLNSYSNLSVVMADGWEDVGDSRSLAAAQRRTFTGRSFHSVTMDWDGMVHKKGWGAAFAAQASAAAHPAGHSQFLYPRAYTIGYPELTNEYVMEHVDLPSLAELWLYWPSVEGTWRWTIERIHEQMTKWHWPADGRWVEQTPADLTARAELMWSQKVLQRYAESGAVPAYDRRWGKHLIVNGRELMSGPACVALAASAAYRLVRSAPERAGWLHGDLNFTNVLWSPRTGNFKLLDPRGEWGGPGQLGDLLYEAAKLAYSPTFSAIVHGLYTLNRVDELEWQLDLWPRRKDAEAALHDEIAKRWGVSRDDLDLARLLVLLSGAPLHEGSEANALYLSACILCTELAERGAI